MNVLNHIRWADKQSMANKANKEQLRRYINNSEDIIFAEQFVASDSYNNSSEGLRGYVFEPIRAYLDETRIQANISKKETNIICNVKNTASRH